MTPEYGLTDNEWDGLVEGFARGEYNLLLGSGASLGSTNPHGEPLPNARDFSTQLLHNFSVNTGGRDLDLKLAYELVEGKLDSLNRNRNDYLRNRFSQCRPTWQTLLPLSRWRRIWTLNIDDVVERAYEGHGNRAQQYAKTFNWPDLYTDVGTRREEIQIVHLHGCAFYHTPDSQAFVFSIVEYLQASSRPHAYHQVFGSVFAQEPFIVVGARLTDEYDLAEFLRRGNSAYTLTGRPTVIVLTHIDDIDRDLFRRWGMIPVQADAERFFATLSAAGKARVEVIAALAGHPAELLSVEALTFLNQFRALRADSQLRAESRHDFYGGHEPNWDDIRHDRDARFAIVDTALRALDITGAKAPSHGVQEVHCIWGAAGAGKSAALLRIARDLMGKGVDAYWFRGEECLDVGAAFWWLQKSPRTVLFFDGLADVAADVDQLVGRCANAGVRLVAVGVERDTRVQQVYSNIHSSFLRPESEYTMNRLTDGDITALIRKLESVGRLGILTRRTPDQRRAYFVKQSSRQLFAAMAELEGGMGFSARVKKEFSDEIKTPTYRDLYGYVCMTHTFGYPLPLGVATRASGLQPQAIITALEDGGTLAGIVRAEDKGLKTRHRVVASMVLSVALDRESRFSLSQSLAKALAPLVSPSAIRQRTLAHRIIRNLMDQDVIVDWVGLKRAGAWYEGILQEYGWNSRFWEQRALLEMRLREFPRARSYAERALSHQRHHFTLNTLGTVLVRMAVEYLPPGSTESNNVFWEGVAYLRDARDLREEFAEPSQHPYTTFFTHTTRLAKAAYKGEAVPTRLANEWQHWMSAAERTAMFSHSPNSETLREFHREWLLLATQK